MAESTATNTNQNINLAFKLAMAGMGFIALKKLGETFGIFNTAEENQQEEATASASASATQTYTNNPYIAFNPNYAIAIVKAYNKKYYPKVFNGVYNMVFSQPQYLKFVTELYDGKSLFGDDEEKIYGVFRQITTQWQLSLLSSLFYYFKKKDLLEYLKSFMNPSEMAVIFNIIKNYPQYKPA
jgi:hypothetical protein